jgi:G3E family GTPase
MVTLDCYDEHHHQQHHQQQQQHHHHHHHHHHHQHHHPITFVFLIPPVVAQVTFSDEVKPPLRVPALWTNLGRFANFSTGEGTKVRQSQGSDPSTGVCMEHQSIHSVCST